MGDTEHFLLGTILRGVVANELRDLPNLVGQSKRRGAVGTAVRVRWVGMIALIAYASWYVFQRKREGAR